MTRHWSAPLVGDLAAHGMQKAACLVDADRRPGHPCRQFRIDDNVGGRRRSADAGAALHRAAADRHQQLAARRLAIHGSAGSTPRSKRRDASDPSLGAGRCGPPPRE